MAFHGMWRLAAGYIKSIQISVELVPYLNLEIYIIYLSTAGHDKTFASVICSSMGGTLPSPSAAHNLDFG